MKSPWRHMTSGDRLLVLALIALSLAGIIWIAASPAGSRIVVTDGDRTLFIAPLSAPLSVVINGPLGPSRLEIDSSGARITAAPCPRKTCMSMGPVSKAGGLIACIPNRILVRVEAPAAEEDQLDLISR